ncbi:MAG: hypothetical protein R3F19_00730 [Verrucomicrobiales bacterium]
MSPLPEQPSGLLQGGFIVLGILVVVMIAVAVRSWRLGLAGFGWLLFTGWIGHSGVLADFAATPPRIVFLFVPTLAGVCVWVFSRCGQRLIDLPLAVLIGYQAFRIPVEMLIHLAVREGVAPEQMTWTGLNLDIVTGVSALLVFPIAHRLPRWGILLWNSIGLGLLAWVVGVAVLSMPTTFQQLEPDNIWVAWFPFIWLPTIAVVAALAGHLAVFRKLSGKPCIEHDT